MGETKKAAHWPGPWRLDERNGRIYADEGEDHLLCDVRGWGWLQRHSDGAQIQDANARLIAAAPDLLEALRPFARFLEIIEAGGKGSQLGETIYGIHNRGGEFELTRDQLRDARDAINLAVKP